MSRGRPRARSLVLAAVLVLALAEIYVLVQVGQAIGAGWTLLLLVLGVVLGGWVIRHEGSRAWRELRSAVDSGRTPTDELADGALVLLGGTLLVVPGFITDALAVLVILPFTRPLFRRALATALVRRIPPGLADVRAQTRPQTRPQTRRSPGPGPGEGPVVRGEVVDDDS